MQIKSNAVSMRTSRRICILLPLREFIFMYEINGLLMCSFLNSNKLLRELSKLFGFSGICESDFSDPNVISHHKSLSIMLDFNIWVPSSFRWRPSVCCNLILSLFIKINPYIRHPSPKILFYFTPTLFIIKPPATYNAGNQNIFDPHTMIWPVARMLATSWSFSCSRLELNILLVRSFVPTTITRPCGSSSSMFWRAMWCNSCDCAPLYACEPRCTSSLLGWRACPFVAPYTG